MDACLFGFCRIHCPMLGIGWDNATRNDQLIIVG
jgi:hypothetical protein